MEREEQARTDRGASPVPVQQAAPGCCGLGRHVYRLVGFGVAAAALAVAGFLFLRVPPPDGGGAQNPAPPDDRLARLKGHDGLPLFHGWPRPDVALLLSGQQHGYYQPCGCSSPQYGGLVRRFNFLKMIEERGWPVVAVDLGEIADAPSRAGVLTLLKYEYSMKALRRMDYTAVSFGLTETALPLHEAMGSYALNNPSPRVLGTNLLTRVKTGDPFHETIWAWQVGAPKGAPAVGVIALHGPSVEKRIKDPDVRFHRDTAAVLDRTLAELKAKRVELVALLYHGTLQEAERCVSYCAQRRKASPDLPPVGVVLCLTEEDTPPSTPDRVGDTCIVRVGHKGRYVGVVGAYRTGRPDRPWDLRYQLIQVGPEFETPAGKEKDHPVMDLIEEYAERVKAGDYLAKAVRLQKKHSVQLAFPKSTYVGSEACQGCHKQAYKVWADSKHAHAHDTLVSATGPKLRQFDPECITCHVTGFGLEGGFREARATDFLKHVGCESCHGPCSEHAENPKMRRNPELLKAINPFKTPPNETPQAQTLRLNRLHDSCFQCHDNDNSVHFQLDSYWKKIAHPTPRNGK
ncbi:MAG: hypothetical protein IT429_20605 [Gemmataceae bacterium]|nr:hypothetical protein [Gemmataceae bacterium]